jgi:hypothetical protein
MGLFVFTNEVVVNSAFSDFARYGFVFHLAAATDWNVGWSRITDATFFTIQVCRRQRWQWS